MTLTGLLERVRSYDSSADIDLIRRAYDFSAKVHQGQMRKSGEPYLVHPLEVAGILTELKLDEASVVTGLLHDTVEDTLATLPEMAELFGDEIADLVDGVTKLCQFSFNTREEKQAENFRKMVVAMAKDIRVLLVKLADRTHNMRTLEHMTPERQDASPRRRSTSTRRSPTGSASSGSRASSRTSPSYLRPEVYDELKRNVAKTKAERERYIEEVVTILVEAPGGERHRGRGLRPGQAPLLHLPQDAVAGPALRPDPRRHRASASSSTRCPSATRRWASSTPTGSRSRGASRTTSPSPSRTCYQSLHTTVIGPAASASRCRSAPTRCTGSPRRASPPTGRYKERQRHGGRARGRRTSSAGCASCSSGSRS